MRVAACVECATPIIGERLRCPRCHEAHARELATRAVELPGVGAVPVLLALVELVVVMAIAIYATGSW